MTQTHEQFQFILSEFLLVDSASETPKFHPKRKEIQKGKLQKMIESFLREAEELELEMDLDPYKEALTNLRKIKSMEAYHALICEIFLAYAPKKKETVHSSEVKNIKINPLVSLEKLREREEKKS